jgi:gluconolactonase
LTATLDFYKSLKAAMSETPAQIIRQDAALDEIVPKDAKIEKLAGGFLFTEGPVWVRRTEDADGYLLFSDPNNNVICRWTQDGQLSIFMTKSGYRGMAIGEYGEVFFDMTSAPGEDALDGLKVDQRGNLYVSGPGVNIRTILHGATMTARLYIYVPARVFIAFG